MGILDEAIREHLELKRAHGASEDELRRQEAEVFGPVRTEVSAQPPPEGEEAPAEAEGPEAPGAAEAPRGVEAPRDDGDTPAEAGDTAASELDAAQPEAEDPYVVHPGDHPVPDPNVGEHPVGSDPAWGEDAELFADHDAIRSEEHPPEPAYRPEAAAPAAPEVPTEVPPVEEPPVEPPPVEEPDDEPGEEEDVLEETPEFLQDAPEHDRLWFEQKPPRDFDFGE